MGGVRGCSQSVSSAASKMSKSLVELIEVLESSLSTRPSWATGHASMEL